MPAEAAPGQYLTAIAAEHAEGSAVEGSETFTQKLRYVVPVFITVPGPTTTAFDIGEVTLTESQGTLIVEIPITNSGDVRVRPEGEIGVLDEAGTLLATIPVAMESVYARDATVLTVGVPLAVGSSTYQVRINLHDPDSGVAVSSDVSDLTAEAIASPEIAPIAIRSATATPVPAADNVQFANVEATISNTGEPVANAQLALIARLDGEEVERFPISQSLSLPTGETPIATRYIPATGWTSGEWTFELLLETVEPSGAAVVVDRLAIEGAITIP